MQGSTSSKVWAYCMSANQVIAMEIGSGSSASATAWTAKCDNSNYLAGSKPQIREQMSGPDIS